jgi:GNAT superfamily N-acetyltransferase
MTVRLATTADLARVARTATMAFADDPVMRWFYPDPDYFELSPSDVEWMGHRWLGTDSLWCTDDAVAMAGWIPPGRPDVEMPPVEREHPPWRLERFAAIRQLMAAHTPVEPHWYLNMLATHPDWQRQGLGASLLQPAFDIADDMGVPCYLETETIENVAYYRHHGFEVRTEWDVPLDGPHMWGMLRAV